MLWEVCLMQHSHQGAVAYQVIERYELPARITANQNLLLLDIEPSWKADIVATLGAHTCQQHPDDISSLRERRAAPVWCFRRSHYVLRLTPCQLPWCQGLWAYAHCL